MATKEKKVKHKHKNNTDGHPRVDDHDVGPNIPDQELRKKSSKFLVKVLQGISYTSSMEHGDDTLKTDETSVVEVDNAKKEKKRKRRETENHQSGDEEGDPIQQLPAKKRKNRTEFTDPREDSALNNQSRKALEYAFMQLNKPSKWKFNKARQNWIIRNLWSPDALPEIYLPLTLKYLSKIQGGSRTKLIEESQTILHQKDTPPDPQTSPEKTMKISEPGIDSIETTTSKAKPVPGPLISTDSTPGVFLDSELSSAAANVNETHALEKIKKLRAQQLLEVLS